MHEKRGRHAMTLGRREFVKLGGLGAAAAVTAGTAACAPASATGLKAVSETCAGGGAGITQRAAGVQPPLAQHTWPSRAASRTLGRGGLSAERLRA